MNASAMDQMSGPGAFPPTNSCQESSKGDLALKELALSTIYSQIRKGSGFFSMAIWIVWQFQVGHNIMERNLIFEI